MGFCTRHIIFAGALAGLMSAVGVRADEGNSKKRGLVIEGQPEQSAIEKQPLRPYDYEAPVSGGAEGDETAASVLLDDPSTLLGIPDSGIAISLSPEEGTSRSNDGGRQTIPSSK